ncbi:MAG: tetratricopeptide repeat protein [Fibrobacter sp.]|jgi:tetratricopeptide (TPR) repeat protein|nr:tetratricopeptide repeat protein [Fibrobacter sp.]
MTTVFCPIKLILRGNNSISTAVLVFLCIVNVYSAAPPLPEDLHQWAIASLDHVYNEDLKESEEEVRRIIRKYPDHPAGYFMMAVVIDAWMVKFQSKKKENEFYRYCDLAIEKGEKLLSKDPGDQWAKFFIGGADGYKGTYEARYERWITAFRYGWKGVSVLLELQDAKSDIVDINYGVGSYDYWRSALMKVLWWMPGVEDKRESGIQKLYVARQRGVYTRNFASSALVDILLNEKRYKEALEIADEMLQKYKRSTLFQWGKARALFGLKRYDEARMIFQSILSKVEADPQDNHYNAALCHLLIAKIDMELNRYEQVIAEVNRMGHYEFDNEVRKRLDKPFSEARHLKRKALSAQQKREEISE